MDFEELLVTHASPTLANMKPASLISLKNSDDEKECIERLEKKGLLFLPLSNSRGQRLLLVYRKDKLERALSTPLASRILECFGYPESLQERLEFLRKRFLSTPCPHEVGIFLGYPPDDVKGFIENKGQGALYSGLWKVYSDRENAERILQKWSKCRRKYLECFLSGTDIARLCVTA